MKNKMKLSAALGLSALALSAVATPVFADTVDTTGSVTFTDNGTIDPEDKESLGLIKPGTESQFIWVDTAAPGDGTGADGNNTTGKLRFSNIPSFKFGQAKISSTSQSYNSKITSYKLWDTTTKTPTGGPVNIPQFVQVVDETGLDEGFKVSAKASIFATSGNANKLENSRIQFYGGYTLRNNVIDKADANNVDGNAETLLSGFENKTLATGAWNELSATDVVLFQTKTNQSSNASTSSLVFDPSYTSAVDYSTKTENSNVKLYVPAGEKPVKDKLYTSTITWSLTNAL